MVAISGPKKVHFPAKYIKLCQEWHSGLTCMLYAVASSGGVKLGTHRPWNDDHNREMTDLEWHHKLWFDLSCDAARLYRHAKDETRIPVSVRADLLEFSIFCDATVALLEKEYNLAG